MPRSITNEVKAEFAADNVRLAYLADLTFINGYVLYLWTGSGNLEWNSHTYLGNGWLKPPQGMNETSELKATGCVVTLVGVSSELIAIVLAETSQDLPGIIRISALNAAGNVIASPVITFKGNLDVPTIMDSPSESVVQITYESDLIKLGRSNDWRYTNEAQRSRYPLDRGLEYIHSLEKWDGYWGVKSEKKTKKDKKANVRGQNNK